MDNTNALSAPMIGKSRTNDDSYRPADDDEGGDWQASVLSRSWSCIVPCHEYPARHLIRRQHPYASQSEINLLALTGPQASHALPLRNGGSRPTLPQGYFQWHHWICRLWLQDGPRFRQVSNRIYFHKNIAPISWRSTKQTVTATSTNHPELLSFHEASRETIWLRTMQHTILQMNGLPSMDKPTTIFKDNAICIEQFPSGFIKADRVKHINPHLFGLFKTSRRPNRLKSRRLHQQTTSSTSSPRHFQPLSTASSSLRLV